MNKPKIEGIDKVLIIGSGPIIIGQACEFDYSGTQACKALRAAGYKIVLVNSNPATIMTDPGMADITYIEPLTIESVEKIIKKERPQGLLPSLGGQTGLNLAAALSKTGVLKKYGVQIIGIKADAIERGEDRDEFKKTMKELGISMPESALAYSVDEALNIADRLGYPVVIRPAYTTVSYTHLRAHETPEHLVCRLLLEKKKITNTKTKQNKKYNTKMYT